MSIIGLLRIAKTETEMHVVSIWIMSNTPS